MLDGESVTAYLGDQMFTALVLAASMMGQLPSSTGPPRQPTLGPASGTIDFYVFKAAPTVEDLRIQAIMDEYAMDPNAGMRRGAGYPHAPIRTTILRRDTPAGIYLVGRVKVTTPIPLGFAPYLGQSVANR